MNKPIKIAVLGLGRIGLLHCRNIAAMPEFDLVLGADPYMDAEKEAQIRGVGVPRITQNPDEVFDDPEIEAVAIVSATDTHSDFITRAARRGMAAFCEKPIDNDVSRIVGALRAVKEAGTLLQVGFSRRFDKHHSRMQQLIAQGKIGDVNLLKITSRDPAPPTYAYIEASGGIFVDMMIHDFDMARFMMGSEVTEVYATGAVLCDPLFEKAGDVDTAIVTLKFQNGSIGVIDNSRRSGFGHDQRVEVLGSQGCLMDQNQNDSNVLYYDREGMHTEPVQHFFLERYNDAFINELQQFARCIREGTPPPVTGLDGLQAVLIAEAAARSAKSGKAELVEQVEI